MSIIAKAAEVIAPLIPERYRLDGQHTVIASVLNSDGLLFDTAEREALRTAAGDLGERAINAEAELERIKAALCEWRRREWVTYQNRQGLTSDYAAATVHEISVILEGGDESMEEGA